MYTCIQTTFQNAIASKRKENEPIKNLLEYTCIYLYYN